MRGGSLARWSLFTLLCAIAALTLLPILFAVNSAFKTPISYSQDRFAPAIPPSPDQAPMAGPRSSFRNDASMSASDPGVSSAPPTPCSARAAISISTLGATAHSSEATANHATPITNTRRRP